MSLETLDLILVLLCVGGLAFAGVCYYKSIDPNEIDPEEPETRSNIRSKRHGNRY